MKKPISYRSPMGVQDCLAAIDGHAYGASDALKYAFDPPPAGTVLAKRGGSSCRIHVQGPRHTRNSFIPFFFGSVTPDPAGCRIQGAFRLHPFVKVFMTVWFAFVGLFCLVGLVFLAVRPAEGWLFAAVPLVMVAFDYGLVRFGAWFSKDQLTALERFLTTELLASRSDGGGPEPRAGTRAGVRAGHVPRS
jgi:hypothetical protein